MARITLHADVSEETDLSGFPVGAPLNLAKHQTLKSFYQEILFEFATLRDTVLTPTSMSDFEFNRNDIKPEDLAAAFVKFFNLKPPIQVSHLVAIGKNSGISITPRESLGGPRGVNCTYNGQTSIDYKQDEWQGSQVLSILHELYEVTDRTLCDYSDIACPKKSKDLCKEAEKFAVLVQAPSDAVKSVLSKHHVLDVFSLKNELGCSYVPSIIRLAEVINDNAIRRADGRKYKLPLIILLFERPYWNNVEELQLTCFRKTQGWSFPLTRQEVDKSTLHHIYGYSPDDGPVWDEASLGIWMTKAAEIGQPLFVRDATLFVPPHSARPDDWNVDVLFQPVYWKRNNATMKVIVYMVPSKFDEVKEFAQKIGATTWY